MNRGPLDAAFTAAKSADAATMAAEYEKAATLHREAADYFAAAARLAPKNPALHVLEGLAKQHKNRAVFLESDEVKLALKRQARMAKSVRTTVPSSLNAGREPREGAGAAATAGDWRQQRASALGIEVNDRRAGTNKPGMAPPPSPHEIESFYVVGDSLGASTLGESQRYLKGRSLMRGDSCDAEVERLRAENEHLRAQYFKLKKRWDDLRKGARQRKNGA